MSSSRGREVRGVGRHYDGDLRADLIAAAARRIAAVGAENLSLRDVARGIGVSHAAPTHHFGDKSGLLTAVAAEGFRRFVEHFGAAIATGPDRAEDLLVRMTEAYAEFARTNAGFFDVMFRPALIDVDDPAYLETSHTAFAALQAAITHCQDLGWHPNDDPHALALATWSFAHGISTLAVNGALRRHSDNDRPSIADIAHTLVNGPSEDGASRRAAPRRDS